MTADHHGPAERGRRADGAAGALRAPLEHRPPGGITRAPRSPGSLAAVRARFPNWLRPWRSDAGRWWVTRAGRAAPGYPMTVDGDDEAGLAAAIVAAEEARARSGT